jgi:hypothetical protein
MQYFFYVFECWTIPVRFSFYFPVLSIFLLYRGQFYWWRKPEYPDKTSDLSELADKLYHIKLCLLHLSVWAEFKLASLVVIGNDCMDSCKSNYHTITATTAPFRHSKIDKISLFRISKALFIIASKSFFK